MLHPRVIEERTLLPKKIGEGFENQVEVRVASENKPAAPPRRPPFFYFLFSLFCLKQPEYSQI